VEELRERRERRGQRKKVSIIRRVISYIKYREG